jgi:hypothetical protein
MSLMFLRIKRFKVTHAVRNKNRIRHIRSRHYLAIYPVLLTEHHLVHMEWRR